MKFVDKIFFYGQLKSDGIFFPMYKRYVLNIEKGYTYGTLYKYKNRPVYIPRGDNKIYGEILTFFNTKTVFKLLDNVEYYLKRILGKCYRVSDNSCISSYIYIIEDFEESELSEIATGIWLNKK
ncbi:gamma-glutamylcyclotransferase [Deferribacteraceae bacterium V6Fe1]|nr:gamma-glutamylcyclotransferase [Deferribacteraceae bacterium V6Fe1]